MPPPEVAWLAAAFLCSASAERGTGSMQWHAALLTALPSRRLRQS